MPEVVKKGSLAAAGICQWVRAMIIYDRVAKTVGPKKEQLAAAEAELAEAMAMLKVKQDELKAVLDMLQKLEDDFKASKQKQDDLEFKSRRALALAITTEVRRYRHSRFHMLARQISLSKCGCQNHYTSTQYMYSIQLYLVFNDTC